jgi:hypothetical protein
VGFCARKHQREIKPVGEWVGGQKRGYESRPNIWPCEPESDVKSSDANTEYCSNSDYLT